ncbi:MAG: elongation factor P [Patescibacteria group bacterium]
MAPKILKENMLPTDLKVGTIYKENNQPYKVEKYTHTKVARGGATVKVRARNLITGNLSDFSYNSSVKLDDAETMRKNVQYLYQDRGYVFMEPTTYEQFTLSEDLVGESAQFLKEGDTIQVLYFEGNPVSIELSNSVVFEVTYTEPGFKGNTVTNTLKDATLSNGTVVKVPTFIKIGDTIKIDTRTGDYISKA